MLQRLHNIPEFYEWSLYGILMLWAAFTTLIPWSIPLLYSSIGGLLVAGKDPLLLTIFLTAGGILGTCFCRTASGRVLAYREKQNKEKKESNFLSQNKRTNKHLPTLLKRCTQFLLWRKQTLILLEQTVSQSKNKRLVFVCLALCIQSSIPDIVIVLLARKKVSFRFFVGAVCVGKLFVYTPFIYAVEILKIIPFFKTFLS